MFQVRCEISHSDQSNAARANLTMSTLLIPWKKSTSKEHADAIKWSHGDAKHEIFIPVLLLEDLELMFLLPHCLETKEILGKL
jgi:hypothetical protein